MIGRPANIVEKAANLRLTLLLPKFMMKITEGLKPRVPAEAGQGNCKFLFGSRAYRPNEVRKTVVFAKKRKRQSFF